MKKSKLIKILIITFTIFFSYSSYSAEQVDPIKVNWSFKGLTGKFDRSALQRGFQVYKEVCSSCHSMQYLSYRNLGEPGGPEFSETEVKAIAASIEIEDGPDSQGEMFTRPGRPSDKFKSPYPNVQASTAANGGAYPPDMSVLVGYEDPPSGIVLDDGVYYNKYMIGNKIKMSAPLLDGIIEYTDGTEATVDQMAKDVTTFLSWAAEPELEERHRTGVKVIIYLILLTVLVYLSMKKIWSRIDSEV